MLGIGKKTHKMKKFPVLLPSYPHFYDMEADFFSEFENVENKPDLL